MQQIGLDAVLNNVPDFTGGIDKMNRAVDSFASNGKQAGADFGGGFGEIVTGALRKIGELSVQALLKAGQAVTGFVKDSIGLAGDFQAQMLEFQSVAGKDVDTKGLEQFRDLFLDIGKRLPVSTSEVQQAAIEMVKGGIDPATIAAGGLEQNIKFASAAMGGDLVKAAEISSKILGGWTSVNATAAEKSDFLTHSTDMLAKAANASSTDVEGLSRGIFQAQGIAKTAGVSFDDLTTTLAELAPRFASSAEAGTSLKNFIARMQPTTAPAIAAMEQLGLFTKATGSAFYDAQGNFVGFQQASQLLQDSLAGLTKEQQAAALQTIFGNDAMSSAAALAELGAAGYTNMANALTTANGVQEAAALKQQGFNTALDNAKGSVEALQIQIGTYLLPILTDLLNNYIAPGVNAVTDFAAAFMKMAPAIAASDDPIQTFLNAMKILAPNALNVISVIEDVKDGIAEIIGWFSKAGGAADNLGGVLDDLSGVFQHYMDVVNDVMNGYMQIVQAILPQIAAFWDSHGTEISAFLQAAYDKIVRIVNLALDLYDAIVPKALGSVADWIDKHATGIQAVLSGAWQAISAIIDGALTLIEGTIKIALDLINGDWDKAWADLKEMSATFVLDIGKLIEGGLEIIAGFFNTNLQEIANLWQHNWEELYRIATETDWVQVGQDVVDGIMQGLKENWDRLMGWLSEKAHDLVNTALEAIGAGSPAKDFMPVGEFSTTGIMKGFKQTWPQLIQQVGGLSEDLISSMSDIGTRINEAVADGFGATASIDRQIAKNLDRFKDVLPQYQQYTQGALQEAQQQAMEFADPAQGAKFFKMRSDQILEYAKLQKDLNEATSQEDKDRIQQQMLLINRAQQAEISQFDATRSAVSPLADIANQINEIMKTIAGINLTDDQIHIVDQLAGIWSQLQTPVTTQRTPYNPGPATTNTHTTNLNMPIYTNNSPTAMQSSMAIAAAALM